MAIARVVMIAGPVTTNELLKANVLELLRLRGKTPEQLWHHVGKNLKQGKSWWDKIYRENRRSFPLQYWKPISKFFGVEVYDLIKPGIGDQPEFERRVGDERRKRFDRRISQAVISEKPLDVDLIYVIRALSPKGRQLAIGTLMDILNDEMKRLRSGATALDAPDRTDDTPPIAHVPKKSKK